MNLETIVKYSVPGRRVGSDQDNHLKRWSNVVKTELF
jgi:hypothetical protein